MKLRRHRIPYVTVGDGGRQLRGSLAAGSRIGRYELIRRLAHGGMAELYLARVDGLHGFKKLCALKLVLPHLAEDREFVEMFLEEARLAATLDHPNIAQVIDIGEVDEEHFLVMEYIHGKDVRALMKAAPRGKPPLECALTIALGIAAGLHYVHERRDLEGRFMGLVHRDVSPSNIVVSFDGSVKLVDFGIAKATHLQNTTRSGVLKGKVNYMAPEQCQGLPIDRRTDIFALGILLYEMTTGRRLFTGDNDFHVMSRIVRGEFERPTVLDPSYPIPLENILLKALAALPKDRHTNAQELQVELETFARDHKLRISPLVLTDYLKDVFGDEPYPISEEAEQLTATRISDDDRIPTSPSNRSRPHAALATGLHRRPSPAVSEDDDQENEPTSARLSSGPRVTPGNTQIADAPLLSSAMMHSRSDKPSSDDDWAPRPTDRTPVSRYMRPLEADGSAGALDREVAGGMTEVAGPTAPVWPAEPLPSPEDSVAAAFADQPPTDAELHSTARLDPERPDSYPRLSTAQVAHLFEKTAQLDRAARRSDPEAAARELPVRQPAESEAQDFTDADDEALELLEGDDESPASTSPGTERITASRWTPPAEPHADLRQGSAASTTAVATPPVTENSPSPELGLVEEQLEPRSSTHAADTLPDWVAPAHLAPRPRTLGVATLAPTEELPGIVSDGPRRRWLFASAAAVIVVSAIAGGLGWSQRQEPEVASARRAFAAWSALDVGHAQPPRSAATEDVAPGRPADASKGPSTAEPQPAPPEENDAAEAEVTAKQSGRGKSAKGAEPTKRKRSEPRGRKSSKHERRRQSVDADRKGEATRSKASDSASTKPEPRKKSTPALDDMYPRSL